MAIDYDKAKGMIWGLLIGDALGSPIQFTDKDSHELITDMKPCKMFGTPKGCWTDDGSMALCIMDSYVRMSGYNLYDIAKTFSLWYNDGYMSSIDEAFDIGMTTRCSIYGIDNGIFVNGKEDDQGNGSIMRFAPSYLIAREDGFPDATIEVSNLTHASSTVQRICRAFEKVLDEIFEGKKPSTKSVYSSREDVNVSGWAVSTFNAALWAFENGSSFEECLLKAVNLGGDSDTIGAVAGQIAGAWYGFSAIPRRWIEDMKDWKWLDEKIDEFLTAVLKLDMPEIKDTF